MEETKKVPHDDWALLLETAKEAARDYLSDLENRSVNLLPQAENTLDRLAEEMPIEGSPALDVLKQLISLGRTSTILSTGPNYYGFVTGGALPIALAARWLSDVWDQNAALEVMSPLSARLENLVEQWLIELLGLPKQSVAGFVSGSSVATLCALAAAREHLYQRADWPLRDRGLNGAPSIEVYGPDTLHGSIEKALRILGFGRQHMHWLKTDESGRLNPDQLPTLGPLSILILQAGQVCTGAFDDFETLIPAAKAQGAWVHIDGAFGLWAAASKLSQPLVKGVAVADSWVTDAHKTLNVPYDSGIVFCRYGDALTKALSSSGSYLQSDRGRDGMDLTLEMSRRARAIELWATIKSLGSDGIAELVTQFCDHAALLHQLLEHSPYTIVSRPIFNQMLVALADDDATTRALTALQQSGKAWVSGAQWQGRQVIRISICNWRTEAKHIERLAHLMIEVSQA